MNNSYTLLSLFRSRYAKVLTAYLGISLLTQIFYPSISFALTGGPTQPEVQGFEPIGTSQMVDLFSGDFTYNIPLLDVGGYPINMSYSSGVGMDQEASWVGLGWNLNPGAVNRNARGLPDDFKGDKVTRRFNIKKRKSYSATISGSPEVIGIDLKKLKKLTKGKLGVTVSIGANYNNYTGVGVSFGVTPSLTAARMGNRNLDIGLGLSASSGQGVSVSPSVSLTAKDKDGVALDNNLNGKVGLSVNSRSGVQSLTYGLSYTYAESKPGVARKNKANIRAGKVRIGANGGSSIDFSTPTYVPYQEMPMVNVGATFQPTIGGEFYGVHQKIKLNASFSSQILHKKEKETRAFGYMYAHKASKESMHDFNRERDGAYTKDKKNLPLTNQTYDIFSVSGQGVGGMYRPFRNDIGIVHDPFQKGISNADANISVGGEFGVGGGFHLGADVNVIFSTSNAGKWEKYNDTKSVIDFRTDQNNSLEELVYFKQAGEKVAEQEPEVFEHLGGFDPIRTGVNTNIRGGGASRQFVKGEFANDLSTYSIDKNKTFRKSRKRRNQAIRIKTASEAEFSALTKKIEEYRQNTFALDVITGTGQYERWKEDSRVGGDREKHHISEIEVTRPDGVRYVYGIPAYNKVKKEVTMSVGRAGDCSTGLVDYTIGVENNITNGSGQSEYFNEIETPGYAHSYLLTAIVSPDYVDIEGDGPSDDDLGTYTQINYSKVNDYQWRIPFQRGKANFNEGLKSKRTAKDSDDKANYTYGKKDVWYMHSITTKNYIAEFTLSDRKDGFGVEGENGGIETGKALKKLDNIKLFTKAEKVKLGDNATPLKMVHFEYDYQLCKGIPNNSEDQILDANEQANQGGKLTLRKLWFTYEHSSKGRLNAYRFNYGHNPDYNIKAYDRWGNYKPNEASSCNINSTISAAEFPYTVQDKEKQDDYASAWSLNSIKLPSGGKIGVEYESDDYAYVQNRRAMQMFKIEAAGTSTSYPNTDGNRLYKGNLGGFTHQNYLFFKLQDNILVSSPNVNDLVKAQYSNGIENLYFRFLTKVNDKSSLDYEFISGYAEINNNNVVVCPNKKENIDGKDYYTHGVLELKPTGIKHEQRGTSVNPISKATWQFIRLYLPQIAYGQASPNQRGIIGILKSMGSAIKSIADAIQGLNRSMMNRSLASEFVPGKSWVRLNNPNYKKLGGGSRVKSVKMYDQWDELAGEEGFFYGQEYTYETEDGKSSGVAQYEPQIGGDENPFKQPIFETAEQMLAPDTKSYDEEPLGEALFPGASVGYSRVTVRDLKRVGVTKNATGRVVHEFYTTKDFPTIAKRTPLQPLRHKPNQVLKFLKLRNTDYMTVSQGYSVELNDMHGKQKGQSAYPEGATQPISSTKYTYKLKADGSLSNQVPVAYKYEANGYTIDNIAQVGVDFDIVADMRQSSTNVTSAGLEGNVDAFLAAILPIVLPMPLPSYAKEKTQFKSSVLTKCINRYALLDKVEAFDLGSRVSTENLLYDGETGEVLLTKVVNQFDDPVYSFSYPAHWAYDRMGMAYKNLGYTLINETLSSLPEAKNFVIGDELLLRDNNGTRIVWITSVGQNSIGVVDRDGKTDYNQTQMIKVLRSGRRNMQSTKVGTVVTLSNPMRFNADGTKAKLVFEKVLNAGATEFTDDWNVVCNCSVDPKADDFNAFLEGAVGSWRPDKSYVYLTDREQAVVNNNTDVRRDGIFTKFAPFWNTAQTANSHWLKDATDWQFTTEVTHFNKHGLELENKDALDRYSAALYGYYMSLPTAVANNAQLKEIGFDNFEDYEGLDCGEGGHSTIRDHFSFREFIDNRIDTESHSGRYSISVPAGGQLELRKVIDQCDK